MVNTRLLIKDRLEGIGWFSYQTLKRITHQNPDVHFVFLFDRDFDQSFIFSDNITPLILSPQARHPILYYWWFQHSVKNLLNKFKPDLFLSPDGFLSLGAKCKQLPVIHDINFLHYPGDSKWLTAKYYNYYFPKFAQEASRIATVSNFSKGEIAQHYHFSPEKIDVVYNGINAFFKPFAEKEKTSTREKYTNGKSYFLYVGSLHPRKNIPNLIRAFSLFISETSADMCLLLVGPDFWGMSEIHSAIKEASKEDRVIFTGRLNNDELANVMGAAMALTMVPYYEGFGIPLVEAMQADIPIICSNVSSLPEVSGDAALLVDPKDPLEIKQAMIQLYESEDLRKSLITKGRIQREHFSWDKTADLMWESIQKVISKS